MRIQVMIMSEAHLRCATTGGAARALASQATFMFNICREHAL